ncbi:hypothetical protein niasHT_033055 [Heterodera trifolii]|uniref:Uncharacterized protein n=1 Tax=Heterodera trifolii TaxID=157864 RepID=A0ABD2INJ5_9BILA
MPSFLNYCQLSFPFLCSFICCFFLCCCSTADGQQQQQHMALLVENNGTTPNATTPFQDTNKNNRSHVVNPALGWLFFLSSFAASPPAVVENGTSAGILSQNAIGSANKNSGKPPPLDFSLIKLRKAGTLDPPTGLELYLLIMLLVALCSILFTLALLCCCCCCCCGRHKPKCRQCYQQANEAWQSLDHPWRRAIVPATTKAPAPHTSTIPRIPLPTRGWLMNNVPTMSSSSSLSSALANPQRRAPLKFSAAQPIKAAEI